jgi:hypothetical protein
MQFVVKHGKQSGYVPYSLLLQVFSEGVSLLPVLTEITTNAAMVAPTTIVLIIKNIHCLESLRCIMM